SRARRPSACVDQWRTPGAVAARRKGTLLHRSRRPDDGGADHPVVRRSASGGRACRAVPDAHRRRSADRVEAAVLRRARRTTVLDEYSVEYRTGLADHAHPELESGPLTLMQGCAAVGEPT